jgi:chaperonin GroES
MAHKMQFEEKFTTSLSQNYIDTMKPISDRVIIKPAPADEKTTGGIIIPDTAKEKPQRGEVIAVGPGKKDHIMTVKKGDKVLYGRYSGQEITHEGTDFIIMREDDILVVL